MSVKAEIESITEGLGICGKPSDKYSQTDRFQVWDSALRATTLQAGYKVYNQLKQLTRSGKIWLFPTSPLG